MEGQDRLQEDFDIIDIIKKLKYVHTIAKSSFMKSNQSKFCIQHTYPNVIDIEPIPKGVFK
jgi:hypothetical protein